LSQLRRAFTPKGILVIVGGEGGGPWTGGFSGAPEAIRGLEQGHAGGKVVIRV
jgi:hypothetical protein